VIEKEINQMPSEHTLQDYNAFENYKAYDLTALEFDFVEPGDLVKGYVLGLDSILHGNGPGMYKLIQRHENAVGIVLHVDIKKYFVTILADCEKRHYYYRSVKKL